MEMCDSQLNESSISHPLLLRQVPPMGPNTLGKKIS